MSPSGPTGERGAPQQVSSLPGWTAFVDDGEYAPDLKYPLSRDIFEKMMTDSQVIGLWRGTTLPVRGFQWMVDPNGAPAETVNRISENYGLPIKGRRRNSRRARRRNRFQFDKHVTDALRALVYGHYYFEKVGEIGDDGKWHLRKLAPRPPRIISEINVERDGGLRSIKVPAGSGNLTVVNVDVELPVERLLAYVWDQEAGNWVGRSMLRACYRNWLIKDRLMRVDAMKHERQGMGVPVGKAPQGASDAQIQKLDSLMRSTKAYERGGMGVPHGTEIAFEGVRGNIPDTIASLRFHNEEMARSFLMMFMQLGQTETGSRALGSEFIDFFMLALRTVADWVCDTFTAYMLEDDVDWNEGEDAPSPFLTYDPITDPSALLGPLSMAIDSGAIQVDDEIENAVRESLRLPERSEPRSTGPVVPPASTETSQPPPEESGVEARARRGVRGGPGEGLTPSPLSLPNRPLRRQPYDHEVQAQVNFASIDANLSGATDQLVLQVNLLQRQQIDELHDLIIEAGGDVRKLAAIQASPVAEESLLEALRRQASAGLEEALGEGNRQGASMQRPSINDVDASLKARAASTDVLLARSISEAAGRQAIRRTAEAMEPYQVADEVRAHLLSLSDQFLKDELGGMLTQGMNSGRKLVMSRNDPEHVYASELLDANTCQNCVAKDGTQYLELSDAEVDYPTGGYKECQGGPRCRGTLVAVYAEAASS